jgi:hypothetical protein
LKSVVIKEGGQTRGKRPVNLYHDNTAVCRVDARVLGRVLVKKVVLTVVTELDSQYTVLGNTRDDGAVST